MNNNRLDASEYESLKADIESMLSAEKTATEKPWTVVRQGRDTPEGWREWLDVWGPDGEPLIGCDENPAELRNVRNAENDAAFMAISRNNFERIARMALRFARRSEALERAVDSVAHGGIPRDKFAKWAQSLGWSSPTIGREEWEHPSVMGCLALSMFAKVTLADVEYIAGVSKKSLAASLEDIFGAGEGAK